VEARTRKRIVVLTLVALLAAGVVYALVLHPGPDLKPQVEHFLRMCDEDRLAEAYRLTSLSHLWGMQDLMEWSTYRRRALGRFEAIESAERLERVSGAEVPTRRMRALLRFSKRKEPVPCTFTFVRGTDTWLLFDLDIPLPSGVGRPRFDERARREAEELTRTLASGRLLDAYESMSRQARRATPPQYFETRMQPFFDGLGLPSEVRTLSSDAQGTGMRMQIEVTYDTGAKRVVQVDLVAEEGHWKASTIEVSTP